MVRNIGGTREGDSKTIGVETREVGLTMRHRGHRNHFYCHGKVILKTLKSHLLSFNVFPDITSCEDYVPSLGKRQESKINLTFISRNPALS